MPTVHAARRLRSAWRRCSGQAALALAVSICWLALPCTGREPTVVSRDWATFPVIAELQTTAKVVAVGDIHGDYKRLVQLLSQVSLVPGVPEKPSDVEWAGGNTVLICTGDLIDKGHHSLNVIACFRALQNKAAAAGGRVIVTMGNHEAEFLANPDDDDKAERFLDELDQAEIDPHDVARGSDKLGVGKFMARLPLGVKINDWFFAHAGSTQGMTLTTLSREIADSVNETGFGAKVLVGERGLLEARLKPIPWWEREHDTPSDSESRLRGYADALGVKHLVMGHQPGKAVFSDGRRRKAGEMLQKFDGLIFLIDVGMSEAIDKSKGAALVIERKRDCESATVVDANGREERLWSN